MVESTTCRNLRPVGQDIRLFLVEMLCSVFIANVLDTFLSVCIYLGKPNRKERNNSKVPGTMSQSQTPAKAYSLRNINRTAEPYQGVILRTHRLGGVAGVWEGLGGVKCKEG